jgi:hypothetical protein
MATNGSRDQIQERIAALEESLARLESRPVEDRGLVAELRGLDEIRQAVADRQ